MNSQGHFVSLTLWMTMMCAVRLLTYLLTCGFSGARCDAGEHQKISRRPMLGIRAVCIVYLRKRMYIHVCIVYALKKLIRTQILNNGRRATLCSSLYV